jgi:hypothetical protein
MQVWRNCLLGAALGALASMGCGSVQGSPSGTGTAGTGAGGGGSGTGGGGGGGGGGASTVCTTYAPTTITAMRKAAMSGCFQLSHVVLAARSASSTTPRLYVQDPAAGDYSAVMAKCSGTAAHACPASSLATALQLLDGASVTLSGYYTFGKVSGFEEFYIEALVDDGAMLPRPAPIALQVANLGRAARAPASWFQRATVAIPAQDPLVMYDFSPAEFQLTGPCPAWGGFGVIPASAGAAPAVACSGATNPPGVSSPSDAEILIGRQFFHGFLYSSDCACAASHNQKLVQPTSSVSGTITGILILERQAKSSVSYQVFEPASDKKFPLQ